MARRRRMRRSNGIWASLLARGARSASALTPWDSARRRAAAWARRIWAWEGMWLGHGVTAQERVGGAEGGRRCGPTRPRRTPSRPGAAGPSSGSNTGRGSYSAPRHRSPRPPPPLPSQAAPAPASQDAVARVRASPTRVRSDGGCTAKRCSRVATERASASPEEDRLRRAERGGGTPRARPPRKVDTVLVRHLTQITPRPDPRRFSTSAALRHIRPESAALRD